MTQIENALMPATRNRAKGVILVLTAGLFWSFAGLAVRLIEHAVEWQILFYRSTTLVGFLTIYLLVARRGRLLRSFKDCGFIGFFAGASLSLAFCCWIYALTHTTVANALFMLSTSPFIAALLGWFFLGEKLSKSLLFFLFMASTGVGVMVAEGYQLGTLFGTFMGLLAAFGFWVICGAFAKRSECRFGTSCVLGRVCCDHHYWHNCIFVTNWI